MCGIIAYTGKQTANNLLFYGLKRLEYRGYDSAGISVVSRKKIKTIKSAGKLLALEKHLPSLPEANCGIGHTRWATHGAPTDVNAHPHSDSNRRISVVHNGIIENADALKTQIKQKESTYLSETDSEVLAHLIAQVNLPLVEAVRTVLRVVQGTYGIAVIDSHSPDTIVVARNGSPVIIGLGNHEMFAASDMSAITQHTKELVHLLDGEIAELTPTGFNVTNLDASPSNKVAIQVEAFDHSYEKGQHEHFLYKEILEQPETITRTLSGRIDERFSTAHLGGLNLAARELLNIKRITILGCGSALYAGMSGAHMLEALARIPVTAEPAAEFRYRNPVIEADTLYVVLSQSGETYDTLAALREVQRKGGFVLGIVNSVGSTIAREVDGGIYMHAGPEVSVASTKAYTSMLVALSLLALLLGRTRDVSPQYGTKLISELKNLPGYFEQALALEPQIKTIAAKYAECQSAFYIGRTAGFPVALEGAQKLKEISYIHAEAYPASELKHGPLALVTEHTPCIIAIAASELLEKNLSTLQEIKARGGPTVSITDSTDPRIDQLSDHVLRIPTIDNHFLPLLMAAPMQLLAYHCAVALKRDVDQPRNLAKSVTVE